MLLCGLTLTAFLLRARKLNSPATPVYDESYMGVIVNTYLEGKTFFFDIHPPFSRLVHLYA